MEFKRPQGRKTVDLRIKVLKRNAFQREKFQIAEERSLALAFASYRIPVIGVYNNAQQNQQDLQNYHDQQNHHDQQNEQNQQNPQNQQIQQNHQNHQPIRIYEHQLQEIFSNVRQSYEEALQDARGLKRKLATIESPRPAKRFRI